ncbi:hypothetical protein FJZ19_04680 [Candidatus Pacearchaeota archaeon]|nr:hypothetical protein [Candidatus Pacearchaeota archaeon]
MLKEMGYLESEELVYVALLQLGKSSAGEIAKKTKLNRVSVYKALDNLVQEGLVSYIIEANKRIFKAVNPTKIREIINIKKLQLNEFEKQIPSLMKLFYEKKEKAQLNIYEGIKGAKTIWEQLLEESKEKDEWLILGAPKSAEILGGYFKDFNNRRVKKKVSMRIIYNKNATELIKIRKKQALTKIKTMPSEYITPASLEVLNDNTLLVIYEPQIIVFYIKNKQVANSFRQYFNLMWKLARR